MYFNNNNYVSPTSYIESLKLTAVTTCTTYPSLKLLHLKCHCNEKIFDSILNTTEQHSHTSLNGVFSFSISCLVSKILSFFQTCKLDVADVIYSRIINYIYQMVNISVNSRQKLFKLCMTIAIW